MEQVAFPSMQGVGNLGNARGIGQVFSLKILSNLKDEDHFLGPVILEVSDSGISSHFHSRLPPVFSGFTQHGMAGL